MLQHKILRDKKAAIGETLTRLFTTVIIIAVLISCIYISSLISKVKTITRGDLTVSTEQIPNMLLQKTSFAYQLSNEQNKVAVDKILNENK